MSTTTEKPQAAHVAQAPKPDPEAMQQRLVTVASWLVKGMPRNRAVETAMQQWQVSRRTAQEYVQRAMAHLNEEAAQQDRNFFFQLSQLQREDLYEQLAMHLDRVQLDPQASLRIIMAMARLLDSRERSVAKMQTLEQAAATRAQKQRGDAVGKAALERLAAIAQDIAATAPPWEANPQGAVSAPPRKDLKDMTKEERAAAIDIDSLVDEVLDELRDESPTAQVAIVPERKKKGRKEMQPTPSPPASRASRALETVPVDNKPPVRAPPAS